MRGRPARSRPITSGASEGSSTSYPAVGEGRGEFGVRLVVADHPLANVLQPIDQATVLAPRRGPRVRSRRQVVDPVPDGGACPPSRR